VLKLPGGKNCRAGGSAAKKGFNKELAGFRGRLRTGPRGASPFISTLLLLLNVALDRNVAADPG
jgi:hypothetical protein